MFPNLKNSGNTMGSLNSVQDVEFVSIPQCVVQTLCCGISVFILIINLAVA